MSDNLYALSVGVLLIVGYCLTGDAVIWCAAWLRERRKAEAKNDA